MQQLRSGNEWDASSFYFIGLFVLGKGGGDQNVRNTRTVLILTIY